MVIDYLIRKRDQGETAQVETVGHFSETVVDGDATSRPLYRFIQGIFRMHNCRGHLKLRNRCSLTTGLLTPTAPSAPTSPPIRHPSDVLESNRLARSMVRFPTTHAINHHTHHLAIFYSCRACLSLSGHRPKHLHHRSCADLGSKTMNHHSFLRAFLY